MSSGKNCNFTPIFIGCRKKCFYNYRKKNWIFIKQEKSFVLLCYKATKAFPAEERFSLTQQIRRAALSVQLNIAEGSSRKSLTERKRFYEIARGSLIEIDAAFDLAVELSFVKEEELPDLGNLLIRCYQMLTKMIYQ